MANNKPIRQLSEECERLFINIISNQKSPSLLPAQVLRQRFWYWTSDVGVFPRFEEFSLDYRLQQNESRSISQLVLQFLQIAFRNLDRVCKLDEEALIASDLTPRGFELLQQSVATQVDLPPGSNKSASPIVESLQAVKTSLDSLYRIGVAIQKSSSHALEQRISTFAQKNHDLAIEDKVYHRLKDQFHDSNSKDGNRQSPLSLYRQLAIAISFRHFGILYRQHRQELRWPNPDSDPVATRADTKIVARKRGDDVQIRNPVAANEMRKLAVTGKMKDYKTSSDDPASTIKQSQFHQNYTAGQNSFSAPRSVASIHIEDAEYPRPPKIDPQTREAKCTFCGIQIKEVNLKNSRWWEQHVDQDTKLYCCLSESCAEPPQLFARFSEWVSHMDTRHSKDWIKEIHPPFNWCCDLQHDNGVDLYLDSEDDYDNHFREIHADCTTEMDELKEWSRIQLERPPYMCPICNCVPKEICHVYPSLTEGNRLHPAAPSIESQERARFEGDDGARRKLLEHIGTHLKSSALVSIREEWNNYKSTASERGSSVAIDREAWKKEFVDPKTHQCVGCKEMRNVYEVRQCTSCPTYGGKTEKPFDPFYCIEYCDEKECQTKGCDHNNCFDVHVRKFASIYPEMAPYHRVLDPFSQMFVDAMVSSEVNLEAQKEMHRRNKEARWFSMRRVNTTGKPELYVFDRFRKLCDPSDSGNTATNHHYPSFVSFVGDTSAGKSTLVRAILLLGKMSDANLKELDTASELETTETTTTNLQLSRLTEYVKAKGEDWPVSRSSDKNLQPLTDPTTFGVHLYLDKENRAQASQNKAESNHYPMLFSDCEGFSAGEATTYEERAGRSHEGHPETEYKAGGVSRRRSPSTRHALALQLQVTSASYCKEKLGIELFYARFLYAISDVVVFITKEDQKIKSELIRVLEWAARSIHRSVNNPSRKTLIIVRHMSNNHDPDLYDSEKLRKFYLHSNPERHLWKESAILKQFVHEYNNRPETLERVEEKITSNERLYKELFNNIVCCYIPNKIQVKGAPEELYKQYRALRDLIQLSVKDGLNYRQRNVTQYNVPAWSHILTRAFEHFATSEKPFDFFLAARRDNPSPRSTRIQDHVANFLRHAFELEADPQQTNRFVMQTVSLALLIHTFHNYGKMTTSPMALFSTELSDICRRAIELYQKEYESCTHRFKDGQLCISRPSTAHNYHTSANGHFEPGVFKQTRKWDDEDKTNWILRVHRMFSESYEGIYQAKESSTAAISVESSLLVERRRVYNSNPYMWKRLRSNKTCLSCLQAVPDHVLGCGHSYCPRCVQELGITSLHSECSWEMHCWLCSTEEGRSTHRIQLKPRCAGARILSLDGGGIRGIVELSILEALHKQIGVDDLLIRDMFDLIVGTSTGGIIALGLSLSSQKLPEMVKFFLKVSENTFSETTAGPISKIGPLRKLATYALMQFHMAESVFSSKALKEEVQKFFANDPSLFAPSLHSQTSTTRVAVTSAKDMGTTTCLITSYNHPGGSPTDNLEREEDSGKDMKIWEAALATSAAPFYLPPFVKKETNTKYIDGSIYANCPAADAYGEIEKLWPDNGASLDILLSIGTGDQRANKGKIDEMRQLNSANSWALFEQRTAPLPIRSRLHRLNPKLNGEYVALFDYKRLQDVQKTTEYWSVHEGAKIKSIADILIANLFFFEPDEEKDNEELLDPLHIRLKGSIRCRLSHESKSLKALLGTIVKGFYHVETSSDLTSDIDKAESWTQIGHPPGQTLLSEVTVLEQRGDRKVEKFHLPCGFVGKKDSNMFQILAMELKSSKSPKKIPISGFPSRIADLQRRSKLKWLQ